MLFEPFNYWFQLLLWYSSFELILVKSAFSDFQLLFTFLSAYFRLYSACFQLFAILSNNLNFLGLFQFLSAYLNLFCSFMLWSAFFLHSSAFHFLFSCFQQKAFKIQLTFIMKPFQPGFNLSVSFLQKSFGNKHSRLHFCRKWRFTSL